MITEFEGVKIEVRATDAIKAELNEYIANSGECFEKNSEIILAIVKEVNSKLKDRKQLQQLPELEKLVKRQKEALAQFQNQLDEKENSLEKLKKTLAESVNDYEKTNAQLINEKAALNEKIELLQTQLNSKQDFVLPFSDKQKEILLNMLDSKQIRQLINRPVIKQLQARGVILPVSDKESDETKIMKWAYNMAIIADSGEVTTFRFDTPIYKKFRELVNYLSV